MSLRLSLLLLLCFPLGTWAKLMPDQMLQLSNGQIVKIISISQMQYTTEENALLIRYQTPHSLDQRKALSEEVDAVWSETEKDAEASGLKEVVITSDYEGRTLFLTSHQTTNFIFEKNATGKWIRLGREEFFAEE